MDEVLSSRATFGVGRLSLINKYSDGLVKDNLNIDELVLKPNLFEDLVFVKYTKYILATYTREILLIFILLVIGFIYRQVLLASKNKELEKLQDELVLLNHEHLYNEFLSKVHPDDREKLEYTYTKSLNKIEIKNKDMQIIHQSRLAQLGEMISMIAHQWKQPLAAISASQIAIKVAMEMNQYNLDDKKQREEFLDFTQMKLKKISIYVQNLSQIVSDFSDFYRPNKKSEIVILDNVILKANNLFGDSIAIKGIKLEFNLDCEVEVDAHENELMQVILNILNNAKDQLLDKEIKNPKIDLRSYEKDDNVFIEIKDNAGGISEDIIKKIFDPYFSTKLEKNGTGLGLYMSKIIIRNYHAGDIFVENIENGVNFIVKISKKGEQIDE